jgi:hypothetical protein
MSDLNQKLETIQNKVEEKLQQWRVKEKAVRLRDLLLKAKAKVEAKLAKQPSFPSTTLEK